MQTPLLAGSVLIFLLAGPAHAQPAPAPVDSIRIAVTIRSSGDRTHELVVPDRGCGNVHEKSAAYEDDVRICSRPTSAGVTIEIDGMTRTGANEYRQRSEVNLPRKGGTIEVGRTGGMRFAVKTL